MRNDDHLDDQPWRPATIDGPLFEDSPFANSPANPSPDEVLVGSLIWRHRGQSNPISIAKLQEHTGLSERTIKGIVEQLVVTHRIRIGGRREDPVGYFVINSASDQEAATKPYRNQILAMWRRLRVLEAKPALLELLGQLRLED